jgi:hypothetical protein
MIRSGFSYLKLTAVVAVLVITLITLVSSSTPAGAAGTNSLAPAPQGSCGASLNIVSVTYKGKVQGNNQGTKGDDLVEVVFEAAINSPCARLGAGVVQDNFGGWVVTVKVTRKNGHQDTGTDHPIKSDFPPGQFQRLVVIPRGLLETDPVSYEASIKASFGELFHKTITLTGNGLPAVGPGVQTKTTTFSRDQFRPDECFPSIQVNDLKFNSGGGHVADTVTVNWNANKGPGCACFPEPKIDIAVQLSRPNGPSTGNIKIQNGTSQTLVNVPVSGSIANGPPTAFTVKVGAENSFTQIINASKSGNF